MGMMHAQWCSKTSELGTNSGHPSRSRLLVASHLPYVQVRTSVGMGTREGEILYVFTAEVKHCCLSGLDGGSGHIFSICIFLQWMQVNFSSFILKHPHFCGFALKLICTFILLSFPLRQPLLLRPQFTTLLLPNFFVSIFLIIRVSFQQFFLEVSLSDMLSRSCLSENSFCFITQ